MCTSNRETLGLVFLTVINQTTLAIVFEGSSSGGANTCALRLGVLSLASGLKLWEGSL